MFHTGVLLAILEKANVISPVINSLGQSTSAGTVSAGYQNFLICIEMLFAAVALRYAFPYQVYAAGCVTDSRGRSVTMQSISSSLKVCIKYISPSSTQSTCSYLFFYFGDKFNMLINFAGNDESKRYYDRCHP